MRTREFRLLSLAFFLVSLAGAGLSIHFFTLLGDLGLSPARAGGIASLAGAAVIVVRIVAGWLLDRFFAPFVAAAMMAMAALCLFALAWIGAPAAALGAVAYGLAIGSEIDMLAYMTGRYFGMHAYGRIYSILYMALLVGAGLSPLLYGFGADIMGSYQLPLITGSLLLGLSAALLLLLPRFQNEETFAAIPCQCEALQADADADADPVPVR